jgi:hypothetical protein
MASLQSYFVLVPWLLMFIIPALSMKTFAEEQQTGTLNWLFSQPLKVSDLVLKISFRLDCWDFMPDSIVNLPLYSLCFGSSCRKY